MELWCRHCSKLQGKQYSQVITVMALQYSVHCCSKPQVSKGPGTLGLLEEDVVLL